MSERYGVYTTANAIAALWAACEATAPQELIEWLADGMGSEAASQLRNLADEVRGVGCLVMADGSGGAARSGNFQDGNSAGALLFSIADRVDTLGAMVDVANEAAFWRHRPPEERSRLGGEWT